MFKKDSSPGPGYMVHPSITRYGKDGTPCYSILGRAKEQSIKIALDLFQSLTFSHKFIIVFYTKSLQSICVFLDFCQENKNH